MTISPTDHGRTPLLADARASTASTRDGGSDASGECASLGSAVIVDDEAISPLPQPQPPLYSRATLALVNAESWRITHLAWPLLVGYALQMSLSMASVIVLGQIGTKELAASALTTMYCNVTGYSVGIGMASALDTLCSQAHTGSPDRHALGKHLQRAVVVMAALSIPIAMLWLFTTDILLFVGQDHEISVLSGILSRWMLPSLFPYLVSDSLKRYLQAQGIVMASMWVTLVVSPINAFLQWFLVLSPYGSIGIIGASVATSISYTMICLLMIAYIAYIEGHQAWGGWDWKEAFDLPKIWMFLKLGTPGVAMVCSEWWAFEILALAAGLLGDKELAAQSIAINSCYMTYMIPMSFSIAGSTRIGNSLGANKPFEAKMAAITAYVLCFLLAIANAGVLFSIRNVWGWVYTQDVEVVRIAASVLPLAALFQISDGIGAVGGGVLRGCGRQHLGAYINLAGYYVFGLPIGFMATFWFHMGLAGMWMGLAIGLFLVSMTIGLLVIFTDWRKEADNALALAGRSDAADGLGHYNTIGDQTGAIIPSDAHLPVYQDDDE